MKPQFEAGRGVAKRGVVRDPGVHRAVIRKVVEELSRCGLGAQAVVPSPIRGDAGNAEFLVLFRKGASLSLPEAQIEAAVEEAQRIP